MGVKILSSVLMLFAAYMGIRHGWAGIAGKPEALEMFQKWNIGKTGVLIFGIITVLGPVLTFIPRTFLLGNVLNAAGIVLMMCLFAQDRDLKGVLIEVPFLLLPLVIIYLGHPFAQPK